MWDIIKDRSDKANMTDHITSYDTVGFHPLQEIPADRIECFEDLYLSARMGLWMQGTYLHYILYQSFINPSYLWLIFGYL